jgi:aryl-alcohol dehydrogenase-like predicted oxidoreductase
LLPKVGGEWLITTKAGESFEHGVSRFDFSPAAIRASVERSLRLLHREVLDLVLVHSDGNDLEVLAAGALDALKACRDEGLIRACGLSGKTVAGGIAALEAGADAVMVTNNLAYDSELPVIERARRLQRGVLIKKALNSGHLGSNASDGDASMTPAEAARASILHSLETPGVTSLVIGTLSPERLRQNAAAAMANSSDS